MVTFEDVVRPRAIITNTDAIWTDRTPVKPLALDVRHQLLKLHHGCVIRWYSNGDADIQQCADDIMSWQ